MFVARVLWPVWHMPLFEVEQDEMTITLSEHDCQLIHRPLAALKKFLDAFYSGTHTHVCARARTCTL